MQKIAQNLIILIWEIHMETLENTEGNSYQLYINSYNKAALFISFLCDMIDSFWLDFFILS